VVLEYRLSAGAPISASTLTSGWGRVESSTRLLITLPAVWFCPCQSVMLTGALGLPPEDVEPPPPPPPPHAAAVRAGVAAPAAIANLWTGLLTTAPRGRLRRGSRTARGCAAGRGRARAPAPARPRCAGRSPARPVGRAPRRRGSRRSARGRPRATGRSG